MSKDLNLCQFIGHLGRDPEVKQIPSGNSVANFSVACGDDYKTKTGDKVAQTNWINVVVWGKLADICGEHLKKGSKVYLSGKQVTRKWQGQDGADRYTTEIIANDMQFLDSRPAGGGGQYDQSAQSANSQQQQQGAEPQSGPEDFDSDIPF